LGPTFLICWQDLRRNCDVTRYESALIAASAATPRLRDEASRDIDMNKFFELIASAS
jgi:hypothetical protein